jgi:hypothetical protein
MQAPEDQILQRWYFPESSQSNDNIDRRLDELININRRLTEERNRLIEQLQNGGPPNLEGELLTCQVQLKNVQEYSYCLDSLRKVHTALLEVANSALADDVKIKMTGFINDFKLDFDAMLTGQLEYDEKIHEDFDEFISDLNQVIAKKSNQQSTPTPNQSAGQGISEPRFQHATNTKRLPDDEMKIVADQDEYEMAGGFPPPPPLGGPADHDINSPERPIPSNIPSEAEIPTESRVDVASMSVRFPGNAPLEAQNDSVVVSGQADDEVAERPTIEQAAPVKSEPSLPGQFLTGATSGLASGVTSFASGLVSGVGSIVGAFPSRASQSAQGAKSAVPTDHGDHGESTVPGSAAMPGSRDDIELPTHNHVDLLSSFEFGSNDHSSPKLAPDIDVHRSPDVEESTPLATATFDGEFEDAVDRTDVDSMNRDSNDASGTSANMNGEPPKESDNLVSKWRPDHTKDVGVKLDARKIDKGRIYERNYRHVIDAVTDRKVICYEQKTGESFKGNMVDSTQVGPLKFKGCNSDVRGAARDDIFAIFLGLVHPRGLTKTDPIRFKYSNFACDTDQCKRVFTQIFHKGAGFSEDQIKDFREWEFSPEEMEIFNAMNERFFNYIGARFKTLSKMKVNDKVTDEERWKIFYNDYNDPNHQKSLAIAFVLADIIYHNEDTHFNGFIEAWNNYIDKNLAKGYELYQNERLRW